MNYSKGSIQRGYTNKLLSVNLSAETIIVTDIPEEVRDYFIGGRSLGLYLLHKATGMHARAAAEFTRK